MFLFNFYGDPGGGRKQTAFGLRKAASDLTLDKMILAEASKGNF